ncbi:MAG: N-6 DNA methylase [Desulfobacterium sp.]|jgi:type I restriction-modification system DNA methylase subunit|nr:N-6 DNA methylase [Desulfobacterium sp.]
MGNAGRNGGEYYTPRLLIRAMIRVIKPVLGETIYDGACGSAGFLCKVHTFAGTSRMVRAENFLQPSFQLSGHHYDTGGIPFLKSHGEEGR